MRDMPYHAQPKGVRSCGAACLCMIYDHFGIACEQEMIFSEVSESFGTQKSCRCYKMVQNASAHGLTAYCISCISAQSAIPDFLNAGFDVIILWHPNKRSNLSHFSTVVSVSNSAINVYLNDPDEENGGGKNILHRFSDIEKAMKRNGSQDEMGADDTLIIIKQTSDSETTDVQLIVQRARMVLDPATDKWCRPEEVFR